jgi:hypothetical protein
MKDTRLGRADKNKPGLYENIRAKRERIKAGSGEKMRKPGQKGAPSASDFKAAAKTAKPEEKEDMGMRSKYDKMKKGCDCRDGDKGSCKCSKKDMGGMKKSPYADGCGYKEDAFARELDAVIAGVKADSMDVKKISVPGPDDDEEEERDDKKCGASGIADNKKCTKGAGGEGRSVAEQKRRNKVPKDRTYKELRQIENEMNKEEALKKEKEINKKKKSRTLRNVAAAGLLGAAVASELGLGKKAKAFMGRQKLKANNKAGEKYLNMFKNKKNIPDPFA